jgi:hypothetical protein
LKKTQGALLGTDDKDRCRITFSAWGMLTMQSRHQPNRRIFSNSVGTSFKLFCALRPVCAIVRQVWRYTFSEWFGDDRLFGHAFNSAASSTIRHAD